MNDPNISFVNATNLINFPWILETQIKSDILLIDSQSKMKGVIASEALNNFFNNPFYNNLDDE